MHLKLIFSATVNLFRMLNINIKNVNRSLFYVKFAKSKKTIYRSYLKTKLDSDQFLMINDIIFFIMWNSFWF